MVGVVPFVSVERRAFARAVASAGYGAAPSVAFARRYSFSGWLAGVLFPAAAATFDVPAFAWRLACPVAVDISCQSLHCQCWGASTCGVVIRWRDWWC